MSRERIDKELLKEVGSRLKKIRNNKGLSMEVVSTDTDLNVFRIEKGDANITLTTVSILCKYYGITLEEFFQGISTK